MAHEQRPKTPGDLLVKHECNDYMNFPTAIVLRLLFA